MEIEIPEILDMPQKLRPLLTDMNKYRYALLFGGRGAGKTQSIARYILYLTDRNNIRVVCGRETQRSISESVYTVFVDLIRRYNLAFDVFSTKIVHKESGSIINFRGFREQGAFNIQGLEGIDILWIDEAQAITKQTLDVLIPTIRKEKAKIFFSMNRHVHDDPVFDTFSERKDCLHININFYDNPFCTEALKTEAKECQLKSQDDYNHIWLGFPLKQSDDCVFGHDELVDSAKNIYPMRDGYGIKLAGYDIARFGDDKCGCVEVKQMGSLHWYISYVDEWDKKDLNYTTGRILTTFAERGQDRARVDEDGIGSGPLDTLNKGRGIQAFTGFRNLPIGFENNKFYCNERTVNAFKLKDMLLKGHIVIDNAQLIKELETLRYTYDSHQRRILISKAIMKSKYHVKSPNIADSLLMAISLIDEVRTNQESLYSRPHPQYSSGDDNLFRIAGVR